MMDVWLTGQRKLRWTAKREATGQSQSSLATNRRQSWWVYISHGHSTPLDNNSDLVVESP